MHKGYTICPLERKSYCSIEIDEREIRCPKCNNEWVARFSHERKVMKSNVDVYLASDLVQMATLADHAVHIILVSCDGDYAEMIRCALKNPNVTVSVLATPSVRNWMKNTLSTRLKQLLVDYPTQVGRFHLRDISELSCFSKKIQK